MRQACRGMPWTAAQPARPPAHRCLPAAASSGAIKLKWCKQPGSRAGACLGLTVPRRCCPPGWVSGTAACSRQCEQRAAVSGGGRQQQRRRHTCGLGHAHTCTQSWDPAVLACPSP